MLKKKKLYKAERENARKDKLEENWVQLTREQRIMLVWPGQDGLGCWASNRPPPSGVLSASRQQVISN